MFSYASPGFENRTEDHFRQARLLFNGVYNWEMGVWHPFATGGAGIYWVRELLDGADDPDSDTRGGLNFGGGIEYFVGERASVKGEARWDIVSQPAGFPDATGFTSRSGTSDTSKRTSTSFFRSRPAGTVQHDRRMMSAAIVSVPYVTPPSVPLPHRHEMERAYQRSDASYDGVFYLGVRTTGIFCRPSCPARKPKPENVEFFAMPKEALFAGLSSVPAMPAARRGRGPAVGESLARARRASSGLAHSRARSAHNGCRAGARPALLLHSLWADVSGVLSRAQAGAGVRAHSAGRVG